MTTSTTLRQPPPAPDGGWGWVAVGAAFVAHIITSGYMLSLSVFLVEWQLYFDINAKTAGLVGVILGFMGPVMGKRLKGIEDSPQTAYGHLKKFTFRCLQVTFCLCRYKMQTVQ
ncbi:hypothetical protein BSL78_20080 [Apostichopus japonicus]|uniref:Uncharacterized protein n=1 Tax=Stichopus japonicus TaxID=307972 RepID=A0A2G8K4Z2_STIJA|nr:hypothetical protein BSL78_20080 [Apostichopus japonicus]